MVHRVNRDKGDPEIRHCEPTGSARSAAPMTDAKLDCFVARAPRNDEQRLLNRIKGIHIMDVQRRLEIPADAAKYDASCASSGTEKRDSRDGGIGSTTPGMGICHSYAPDD